MAKRKSLAAAAFGWLILIAAVAAPLVYYGTREPVYEVTAATAQRGRVEQTVSGIAAGAVKAAENSLVAAEYIGVVGAVHCAEGDQVEEGQLLLELRHAELDAQVELAEANLEVGRSKLAQAKLAAEIYKAIAASRVGQTSAQYEQSKNDLARIEALKNENAISVRDFDQARMAARVAEEAYLSAQASAREQLVRDEEVRAAEAAIIQLEAAVTAAKAARDKAFVKAPFAGIVAKVNVELGEAVAVGLPLLQLIKRDPCYVEAPFDEANANLIKVGQLARIHIDSHRGEEFAGRVTFISPVIQLNPDLSRTLMARIQIEERPEVFVPGMSADVIVIVNEKDDVVYMPAEAIVRERYAYVINGGVIERREIEPGIGNWDTREVVRGLQEGETIVTSVLVRGLTDGVKVKIVEDLESL